MLKLKTLLASLAATLVLLSCMTSPHKAYAVNQAKTSPIRNLTNMDLAMSCLDRLLVEYHVQPVYSTSPGLPNWAGDKAGLSSSADILKTRFDQLSQSDVFHHVDLSLLSDGIRAIPAGAGRRSSRNGCAAVQRRMRPNCRECAARNVFSGLPAGVGTWYVLATPSNNPLASLGEG